MKDMQSEDATRKKQTGILDTVYDICLKAGIKVCLIEETALAACRDGVINDYPVVAIGIADAERLIKELDKDDCGLRCDAIYNDHRHPVFSMDLYDPNTIDFNADNFFEKTHNCMKVSVKLARNARPQEAGRLMTSSAIRIMRSCGNGLAAKVAGHRIMSRLGRVYGTPQKSILIGDKRYEKDFLDDTRTVTVGNRAYAVPGAAEEYFKDFFGETWREHAVRVFSETKDRFRDTDFSWEEYKQRISFIDTDKYAELQNRYRPLNEKYLRVRDVIESKFILLERTHSRIQLWKKYEGRKNEILKLVRNGQLKEAEDILGDYFDKLSQFYEKGLGLSFDPDILDAACSILSAEGRSDYAEALRSLVPDVHMKPFALYDYRGKEITDEYLI